MYFFAKRERGTSTSTKREIATKAIQKIDKTAQSATSKLVRVDWRGVVIGADVAIAGYMAFFDLPELNELTSSIIKGAIEVHRRLGPGLLESIYVICLAFELRELGFVIETGAKVPLVYKGVELDAALRLDILVNDTVVIEVKSLDRLASVHKAQLMSYLRLANRQAGLLINFNVPVLKQGLKRVLNTFSRS